MEVLKIGPKHQITIPQVILKKLRLIAGDFVQVDIRDEEVVLIPAKIIPRDQIWFWTKEWQAGEKEADADIKEGKLYGPFKSVQEFKKRLQE